jgi:hypothetical protein
MWGIMLPCLRVTSSTHFCSGRLLRPNRFSMIRLSYEVLVRIFNYPLLTILTLIQPLQIASRSVTGAICDVRCISSYISTNWQLQYPRNPSYRAHLSFFAYLSASFPCNNKAVVKGWMIQRPLRGQSCALGQHTTCIDRNFNISS